MNQVLLRHIACGCAGIGLTKLLYWLNRRAKRILTFHNVLPDDLFVRNIANGVSCSAREFRSVIRELKRKWRFSTDLFDPETITITFDDGYLNQFEVAARILREEGDIPAMLFSSGDVAAGRKLLVDELLHWAAYAPQDIIQGLGFSSGGELWVKSLWPRYLNDSDTRGRAIYSELDQMYPFEEVYAKVDSRYLRLRLSGIGEDQFKVLRERGWKVGWHTQSHCPLSRLSDINLRRELKSPTCMRAICLSYPYGDCQTTTSWNRL